jgi:hypothetical protein
MSVTASELLRRFAVYGRYYTASFNGQTLELRSHLEIVDHRLGWQAPAEVNADLVAIMMNPGASRPLATLDAGGWAPAVPDRTQYQLMKLALHAQSHGLSIRHIRVINLSDIRTPKSAELFAALKGLKDDRHSIFSPKRLPELERALGSPRVPVLRAWGLASALNDLARRGIHSTASRRVLGLADNDFGYRHPLPQRADLQQAWLSQVGRQIETLAGR